VRPELQGAAGGGAQLGNPIVYEENPFGPWGRKYKPRKTKREGILDSWAVAVFQ
jgi:hypothetical protein